LPLSTKSLRVSAAHNGLVAGSSPAGLPRRSPSGEGGLRGPRATAWQAILRSSTGKTAARADAALASNQNIENNPMQSSMVVAGIDALSESCENILTRRANQRHYSMIA